MILKNRDCDTGYLNIRKKRTAPDNPVIINTSLILNPHDIIKVIPVYPKTNASLHFSPKKSRYK